MALLKLTRSIIEGAPIEVHGTGKMTRDFTSVDDVVEAICRLAELAPERNNQGRQAPRRPPSRRRFESST
jgi:nucleoside-diphosphate-sugar epimerase